MENNMEGYERKRVCDVASVLAILSFVTVFADGVFLDTLIRFRYENQSYDFGLTTSRVNNVMTPFWAALFAGIAVFFVSLVISVMKCGRLKEGGGVCMTWFDRIFAEVHLLLGICAACICVPAGWLLQNAYRHVRLLGHLTGAGNVSYSELIKTYAKVSDEELLLSASMEIALAVILLALIALFELLIIHAIAKKLKNRGFWKGTFIGWLAIGIYHGLAQSEKTYRNLMIVLVLLTLASATMVGAIVVLILIFAVVPKYFARYDAVKQGITEVASGNLEYKINLPGDGEFERLAEKVNSIADAQQIAVSNELKNERMKTELITNVSHDLRTPLTSMITYVDLLENEGLDSPNAEEYLQVIDEKTKSLYKLTEDLFEAAKASSGDIPVSLETLDLRALTEQALGEFSDQLKERDLSVVFTPPEEPAMILGDGRLLYRIMENMLTNVGKYALEGSRVYIDIDEEHKAGEPDMRIMTVKNISDAPLNIDTDELMNRFTRGDDARNTEGSGLGLAIARDLAAVMGGRFRVSIDGDLFKCVLMMPRRC